MIDGESPTWIPERREFLTPTQELKMKLFAQGARPTPAATDWMSEKSKGSGSLTTGDYISTAGIILRVGKHQVINTPYPEENPFAEKSPFALDVNNDRLVLITDEGKRVDVTYIEPPEYLNRSNKKGIRFGDMIVTHTDRARLSPIRGCALDCQFCAVPFTKPGYGKFDVNDLVEAVGVALNDPIRPAQHLLISGGTPGPRDYDYLNEVYRQVANTYPGLDIDIMMTPSIAPDDRKLLDLEALRDLDIKGLSVNLELNDDSELAEAIMRKKHGIGRAEYLEFLEKAVKVFGENGKRQVRSILIVGLESVEQTLAAVEELAKRGVCPELSPFRPDKVVPLRDTPPPSFEDQKRAYLKTQEIIEKYRSKYPWLNDGLQCIDCMHNVTMFPSDKSYLPHYNQATHKTTYEKPLVVK